MATAAVTGAWAPLESSKTLRFATVFLFYFTQGVPLGLFFYAIPAYMAASGASTGEIATVIGITNLPWTLKLVNGFIMDRYAYLPMGRRRAWVLGAQGVMTTGMLAGAALSPGGSDVALLAGLGFVIMAATTFQDVAIDSMVIDIMPSHEQARVGGVMRHVLALPPSSRRICSDSALLLRLAALLSLRQRFTMPAPRG